MRVGVAEPSSHSSAPGSIRSGQSVSISIRTAPARPFAPMILATARRRSLGVGDDLELDVSAIARGHHLEQTADRVGDAAVAADDAAHVLLVDDQGEDGLVTVLLDVDFDGVGLVDQAASNVFEEVLHESAFSFSAASSVAGGSAASAVSSGAVATSAAASSATEASATGASTSVGAAAVAVSVSVAAALAALADAFGFVERVARLGFSAAAGRGGDAAWRMSLTTVSDGWAPLPIQALIRSVSMLTVAGSVSGS